MFESPPLGKFSLSAIAALPNGCLVVAGGNGTCATSMDGGFHWRPGRIQEEFPWADIRRIRCTAAGTVYALGVSGLFVSYDSGETWRAVPRTWDVAITSPFHQAACDLSIGSDGDALLVTSCNYNNYSDAASSGLFRSVDGGVTWECLQFDGDNAFGTASELGGGTRLLAKRDGLDRFDGAMWKRVFGHQPSDLAFEGDRAFLAAYPGILQSTDAGATWKPVFDGEHSIYRMAIEGEVVAGVSGVELFISRDAGRKWITHTCKVRMNDVAIQMGSVIAVGENGAIERFAGS